MLCLFFVNVHSVNYFHIMCIQINPIMYVVYIVIIKLFMPLHDYGHREWLIKYIASCILWIRINHSMTIDTLNLHLCKNAFD